MLMRTNLLSLAASWPFAGVGGLCTPNGQRSEGLVEDRKRSAKAIVEAIDQAATVLVDPEKDSCPQDGS